MVNRLVAGIKKDQSLLGQPGTKDTPFEAPPPVVLIIIDTVSRALQGTVNEDTQGLQTLVRYVEEIRGQFYSKPNVLLLHHPPEGNIDKPRGGGSLRNDVADVLNLKIIGECRPGRCYGAPVVDDQ